MVRCYNGALKQIPQNVIKELYKEFQYYYASMMLPVGEKYECF